MTALVRSGNWPRMIPPALRGPAFGSYAPEDVAWLLTDLSAASLEQPTEQREAAIQTGRAHYAESLPIEYQPSEEYRRLFLDSLASSARRLALAVGLVTEQVLAERGQRPVLVSLARAGTPVGILMRRWARYAHGTDVPHYTVSIVRGQGIDAVALAYLAQHHDSRDIVFVDGWTGKGAIARELTDAVRLANERFGTAFSGSLAVLADTGECVTTFGTREDYLIPSACLNSTVSGLVSRTVLNRALLAPDDFHGAKFYDSLAPSDLSRFYLDAIGAQFASVRAEVAAGLPAALAVDRRPTWRGWRAVEQLAAQAGIVDLNLVKPGVGETTRVLLRRVPWRILVRPAAVDDLAHVYLLAQQRGVDVIEVDDLAFSCVGIIRPGSAPVKTASETG